MMNKHKYISNLSMQISKKADSLTKMEKMLIRDLIKAYPQFTYETFTITNISMMMNASRTSIHRLSKKLGYSSFALFKEDYFFQSEEVSTIASQDFVSDIANTADLVADSITEEILREFTGGKKVTIYGMGINHYIGQIFQIKLQIMGIPCEQYSDSRFMRLSSRRLQKDEDVVILLSSSGNTVELIEVMSEVNKNDVFAVLVTECVDSALVEMGAHVIQIASSADLDWDIDTRLQTHIAMDFLLREVLLFKKRKADDRRV